MSKSSKFRVVWTVRFCSNFTSIWYKHFLRNVRGETLAGLPMSALATVAQKSFKGVLHLGALFLKTLCIFSKNKATLDKVSYGSGQKYSKELKNHSFTSVETIVVKLQ